MPHWRINCLKSEDGTNPSTLSSNTKDETNQTESISSSIDHQNSGKFKFLFFICINRYVGKIMNFYLTALRDQFYSFF